MLILISILLSLLILLIGLCCQVQGLRVNNNNPVIGIVAQATWGVQQQYGDEFIDANYVKYLEMAGAKVVAITGHQSEQFYQEMFNQINGVLLPGGGANLNTSAYSNMSRFFYQKALESHEQGDYFPVWGTCLGFEMLTFLTAGGYVLSNTDSENLTVPLKLAADYRQSRLLAKAPPDIIRYLTREPVAANFHHFSLLTETFKATKSLHEFYRAISFNEDRNKIEFVSTIEAYNHPIYAMQWHPEKNIFMWEADKALDHSPHAVKVAQYMADFFVDEARKNSHHFRTAQAEAKALMENDVKQFFHDSYYQAYYYNVTSKSASSSTLFFHPEDRKQQY